MRPRRSNVALADALLSCAENAARGLGANAVRTRRPAAIKGLDADVEALLDKRGYAAAEDWRHKTFGPSDGSATRKLTLSETHVETLGPVETPALGALDDVEEEAADDFVAQLELAASMKEVATALVDALPDDDVDDDAQRPPGASDDSIEDLVSTLLTALKTDEGRKEFDRLAADQAARQAPPPPPPAVLPPEARLAPRAFVPRPVDDGDDAHVSGAVTTTTIGNARAVAELLGSCVQARLGAHEEAAV